MPPDRPLPRAEPAERGVDPAGIHRFLDAVAADGLDLHGFMLFRRGAVVAEGFWHPYAGKIPHALHSATKSFTAAAIGLAVDDGLLRLDDRVVNFFPEHLPDTVSANLAAMTVRDLLTMRTGHRTGISGGAWRGLQESWVRTFLHEEVPTPPGTDFIYSSASSYMLSAIVSKLTGLTMHDLLADRLFKPLGIEGARWDLSPEGYSTGGNGLTCRLEDLLKFGVLHLRRGRWGETQILSQSWVDEATRNHVAHAWLGALDGRRYTAAATAEQREGYGYQWWMTAEGGYRASGVFGQHCIVLPRHDAVIAFTAGLALRDPRLLDHVWAHLVPAIDTLPNRLASLAAPRAASTKRSRPGLLGMIGAVTSQPLDATTASVNEQLNVLLAQLQTGSDQGMQIYTVQVDFDQFRTVNADEKALRDAANKVPTSYAITADDLRVIEKSADMLLAHNPCFQRLLFDVGADPPAADAQSAVTGCPQVKDRATPNGN